MSKGFKKASDALEAGKAVVSLLGATAFLVVVVVGYIATGGKGLGGFLRFLGLG